MNKNNITKSLLMMTAIFLIAPLFLSNQTVFAGDPGCQSGFIPNPYINNPPPRRPGNENREQRQLAAAQTRNSHHQSPPNGGAGVDSPARSNFSYFSSLLIFFGGLWALFVLLRQRFGKRRLVQTRSQPRGFLSFAFKPSFALSVFGLLFVAAIGVGALTSPAKVGAEKRDKLNKLKMTGVDNPSNKPVFKSAQQIGGDETTQIGAPVFDADGNRYVRGTFTRSLPIGEQTLQESKFFDLFVAKYAPDGTALWARQGIGATSEVTVPGTAIEGATALAVDGGGNVYVGGSFVKKLTLQGGANPVVTLTDDNQPGVNYESFVAKYDQNGNLLWAKGGDSGSPKNADNLEIGQNAIDQIVLDQNGVPYITGFVSGTRFFGSPVINNGQSDILLAQLNPASGAAVWTQIIGGENDDNGLDLKIDAANNLYMIGNFSSDELTFPNVEKFGNRRGASRKSSVADESTNTFIAKFNAAGNTLWAKNLDNENTLGGSQITVSAAGEIFLTGYYFDSATLGATTLTEGEGEGGGEGEDALGGYVTKLDTDGDFLWAKGFGGVGKAIALDAAGRVYVAGTFWDEGIFGAETLNAEMLASFGGEDLFVARYDGGGNFDWAKPISGSDYEGGIDIGNPSAADGRTENDYNPLGLAYDPARQTMFVSGDFRGVLSLDCLTLKTPNQQSRHSYLAELSADNEPTSCRIWNGLDDDDNNWNSPDNWNGNIVPQANDSVYVPYTGFDFDAPDYNPANAAPLSSLVIADDRTMTLKRDLSVGDRLDLLGGYIDAGNYTLNLGGFLESFSVNDGRVIGKTQKILFGSGYSFTFPVGTFNGYSPVTLSNINAGEGAAFAVTAHEGAYPNQANNLPADRAARWWNLDNNGLPSADLTFQYLPDDITTGTENQYRAYRIPTGGGNAVMVPSSINTTAKTVTAPNISEFSDWTLAPAIPTAASVTVAGRVSSGRNAISGARVTLTDRRGVSRSATTNSFGYYRLTDIAAGQTVVLTAQHKRYNFAAQVVTVNQAVENLNFSAR